MTEYSICFNTAPHESDYWTVEKTRRGLFGRRVRGTVKRHIGRGHFMIYRFGSEAAARAWIAQDKKPRTHTCRPA